MKPPVAPDQSCSRSRLRPLTPLPLTLCGLVGLAACMSLLGGCPGQLEGGKFPDPPSDGTGGDSGTGGSGSGSGGATGAACDAPTKVFKATCGGSLCHNGVFTPNLFADDVDKQLIGVAANAPACGETNLVNTTKPASGMLIRRISGSDCGSRMPMMAAALSDGDIQCVKDWIESKL